jgi:hypothetical protein
MFKKSFIIAALCCSVGLTSAVYANHPGGDDDNFSVPVNVTPASAPIVPTISTPPPVFQPPVVASPSTILPTDITGFRSGPNATQLEPERPLTKEELAVLIAKDKRFAFTSEWIPFSADYSANLPSSLTATNKDSRKQFGRVEKTVPLKTKLVEPTFMPTVGASYSKVDDDHVTLHDGAVLIRAGDRPVFVSTKLCHEPVVTRVATSAIAMISAFDGKPTILNLTDKCCGAVVVYLPLEQENKSHLIRMKPGQMAEAYKLETKPTSHLVATRIIFNKRIGPHCGLLVSQCHYIRALRKFNLIATLPKNDLHRIIKTAAAVGHVQRKH